MLVYLDSSLQCFIFNTNRHTIPVSVLCLCCAYICLLLGNSEISRKTTVQTPYRHRTDTVQAPYRHHIQTDTIILYRHRTDTIYRQTPYTDIIYRHHIQTPYTDTIYRHHIQTPYTDTIYRHIDTVYRQFLDNQQHYYMEIGLSLV